MHWVHLAFMSWSPYTPELHHVHDISDNVDEVMLAGPLEAEVPWKAGLL